MCFLALGLLGLAGSGVAYGVSQQQKREEEQEAHERDLERALDLEHSSRRLIYHLVEIVDRRDEQVRALAQRIDTLRD